MKKLLASCLFLFASSPTFAALQYYSFAGYPDPSIVSFVMAVDYSQPGYTVDNSGNATYFPIAIPYGETFFASYISGTFSSAPSAQFRFYGVNSLNLEGWDSCLYALNSIGVCTSGFGGGKAQTWLPGQGFTLTVFDTMGDNAGGRYFTNVKLLSITNTPPATVPLPSSLILFLSSLSMLGVISRKKYN